MNDSNGDAMLLVAYQCGPGLGSVSQLGWQWFTGLAARRPVCLVTHVRNRAAIEAAADRPAGARVIYIDTEWFAGPLYRLSKRLFPRSEHAVFMVSQLDWFVFDAVALRTLRRELAARAPWRLLHLVTPVTVSAPTRLHRLGLPVVRGPLNCGLPVPPGFEVLMRDDAMGLSKLRVLPALVEAIFGSLRTARRCWWPPPPRVRRCLAHCRPARCPCWRTGSIPIASSLPIPSLRAVLPDPCA